MDIDRVLFSQLKVWDRMENILWYAYITYGARYVSIFGEHFSTCFYYLWMSMIDGVVFSYGYICTHNPEAISYVSIHGEYITISFYSIYLFLTCHWLRKRVIHRTSSLCLWHLGPPQSWTVAYKGFKV